MNEKKELSTSERISWALGLHGGLEKIGAAVIPMWQREL